MRQQSLGRKVFEGALSHTGLASAHDLHHAAAFVLLILAQRRTPGFSIQPMFPRKGAISVSVSQPSLRTWGEVSLL